MKNHEVFYYTVLEMNDNFLVLFIGQDIIPGEKVLNKTNLGLIQTKSMPMKGIFVHIVQGLVVSYGP